MMLIQYLLLIILLDIEYNIGILNIVVTINSGYINNIFRTGSKFNLVIITYK